MEESQAWVSLTDTWRIRNQGEVSVWRGESLLHSNLIDQRRKLRGGLCREWTHQGDWSMGHRSRMTETRLQGFTGPELPVPLSSDEKKFTQNLVSGSVDCVIDCVVVWFSGRYWSINISKMEICQLYFRNNLKDDLIIVNIVFWSCRLLIWGGKDSGFKFLNSRTGSACCKYMTWVGYISSLSPGFFISRMQIIVALNISLIIWIWYRNWFYLYDMHLGASYLSFAVLVFKV